MRRVLMIAMILAVTGQIVSGKNLKPYIMGAQSSESLDTMRERTRQALTDAGFSILGEYQPAGDETRWVFVINSSELTEAVQKYGGLTAFAVALRVGLTMNAGLVNISYTDPLYLGNAYFQNQISEVEDKYLIVQHKLKKVMAELGSVLDTPFGSEEGLTPQELRHYHYMFGMPYFEDMVELNTFSNYSAGKSIIESNLSRGGDTQLVYSYEIPGQNLKLYGIALSGESGEEQFLPIIDIGTPKHTAFLPYELLLMGDTAIIMHGRYRIALAFPDLTMTTFSKIMSTPGAIEDLMRSVTK